MAPTVPRSLPSLSPSLPSTPPAPSSASTSSIPTGLARPGLSFDRLKAEGYTAVAAAIVGAASALVVHVVIAVPAGALVVAVGLHQHLLSTA